MGKQPRTNQVTKFLRVTSVGLIGVAATVGDQALGALATKGATGSNDHNIDG